MGGTRGKAYIVAMPCHNIERTMILRAAKELASHLIDNLPQLLAILIVLRYGRQEVPSIRQPIRTQRAQLREFKPTTPYFKDVPTHRLALRQTHAKTQTALNNHNLTRLHEKWTEFGLDIQCALLRDDEELAICVDEGFLRHASVGCVDVCGEAFKECGIA